MSALWIVLGVVAAGSLTTLLWVFLTAPLGYEDDSGFHVGMDSGGPGGPTDS